MKRYIVTVICAAFAFVCFGASQASSANGLTLPGPNVGFTIAFGNLLNVGGNWAMLNADDQDEIECVVTKDDAPAPTAAPSDDEDDCYDPYHGLSGPFQIDVTGWYIGEAGDGEVWVNIDFDGGTRVIKVKSDWLRKPENNAAYRLISGVCNACAIGLQAVGGNAGGGSGGPFTGGDSGRQALLPPVPPPANGGGDQTDWYNPMLNLCDIYNWYQLWDMGLNPDNCPIYQGSI